MALIRKILGQLARTALVIVLAGLVSAVLVRYSPGALVDERELDRRLAENSVAALRDRKAQSANLATNFVRYLRGLIRGDLGYSESNNESIAALIADRGPETLREGGIGLAGGWFIGLGLAIPCGRWRQAWLYDGAAGISAGLLLSLPAAVLAYVCLLAGAKSSLVMILVLAPKVFRFSRNLIVQAYGAAHVSMARARGLTEARILWAHVLPAAAPQMLALAGASVSMAIGAAIPIEAICDVPGLGRLAWQAAMARDLPLLVNLTMLVAVTTSLAMMFSETLVAREVSSQ